MSNQIKAVTRVFTKALGAGRWFNTNERIEVCSRAVRELWNVPADVRRIWITASNYPEPGKSMRIRKNAPFSWEQREYGLYLSVERALNHYFPDSRQVYITVEYEE